jgi:hypothetical protein
MNRVPEIKKQAVMLRGFFAELGVQLTHRQALDRVAMLHGYPGWQVMEKQSRPASGTVAGPAFAPKRSDQFDPTREVAFVWSVGDVQCVRPDLDDEQCLEVLWAVKNDMDCELGINWQVLTMAADRLFGDWHVEAQFQADTSDNWEPVTVNLRDGSVLLATLVELEKSSDDEDFATLTIPGVLRFPPLPDEDFEIEGMFYDAEAPERSMIAQALRDAGADPSTRLSRNNQLLILSPENAVRFRGLLFQVTGQRGTHEKAPTEHRRGLWNKCRLRSTRRVPLGPYLCPYVCETSDGRLDSQVSGIHVCVAFCQLQACPGQVVLLTQQFGHTQAAVGEISGKKVAHKFPLRVYRIT